MYRIAFQALLAFSLIIFNQAQQEDVANFETNQNYDIQRLYREFLTAFHLKDKSAFSLLAKNLRFNKLDRDFSLDFVTQNSSKCLRDLKYTFENLGNYSNIWAMNMIDAFAKPESGILTGNTLWVGEYDECLNVHAPPKESDPSTGNFDGQYCTLAYLLPLGNISLPINFGICLPDSCSPSDIIQEMSLLLMKTGRFPVFDTASSYAFSLPEIKCKPRERQLNAGAICVIVLLSLFIFLAILGSSLTAAKYFKRVFLEQSKSSYIVNKFHEENAIVDKEGLEKQIPEPDNTPEQQNQLFPGFLGEIETALTSFCVFTNGAKLFNTDASEDQLLCIHGIRFLSMSWVILGHTFATFFQNLRNKSEFFTAIKDDFAFQIVLQGFFSVDSFFLLSGFLLTYLAMKEFSRKKGFGALDWIFFYVHRFLRLTPVYMIILGFYATLYFYLGSGPLWPEGDYDIVCRKSWWWNLLYINNFTDPQCMGWSWYLANDMQFFVISPLFLIALRRWPIVGYILLGFFLLITVLCNFILTYKFDLLVGIVSFMSEQSFDYATVLNKFLGFFQKVYVKPYTRIGPYIVGIGVGYIVFRHKTSNRPKMKLLYLCAGWIIASAITLTDVYALYHSEPSLIARCFYNAFSRTCFALGLGWVIYVCLTNQGGIVNSILSYKMFIPLSRLTYCAYLIHPMIVGGYFSTLRRPFEFSYPSTVMVYLGFMVVTYGLSVPVSLILESPIVSLEKKIRMKLLK